MWQAKCIAEHCCAGLAQVTKAAAFRERHLNTMLVGLPDFLKVYHPGEEQVEEACSQWLLRKFKDVHKVITSVEVLRAFCGLCPRAVIL
ncbi:hypothetical protein DUNSADRAFT_7676 [Dunaliella salina]|uniref:Uncharacterized protein n=1 Tax=Dunaliella salina TaxID=3046 RepID=A0ABQ7H676_DUNSA|nr:hypothetical protein DUNSADRAFT_7676 [Dunaliella salina]|eukprot:KAF5842361.1 hypothetical protein DUNSADRAFT_7676 [Dunaliella salina]